MCDSAQSVSRQPTGRLLTVVTVALTLSGAVYALTQFVTWDHNASLFGQRALDAVALKSWLASGVLELAGYFL